jgi:hypothetical protein
MSSLNFEILSNNIVNQPITIALISVIVGLLAALTRYLWTKRKPSVSIVARCAFQDGKRGLSLKITNYSEQNIRIETVGYDIFGGGNPNQCACFIKNETLESESSFEKFIEEKNLHLESMRNATILFMKDQIGRVWKANRIELVAIKRYNEFREQNLREAL